MSAAQIPPEDLQKELERLRIRVKELERRRRRERRTDERLRLMSQVFMDANDPIIIQDTSGRIVDLNAEAERAYGWSREELVGRSIKTIVPPDRHKRAEMLLTKCLEGEELRNVEGLRSTRDGQARWVLLTYSVLCDESGAAIGIATHAKDITERKSLQAQLRQSQKMQAVGQLAGGMAHDFNNLITVILNNADLLRNALGTGGAKPANDAPLYLLDEIRLAAEQGAALTRQLLTFSRVRMGEFQTVDPNRIVASMERMLRRVITAKIEMQTVAAAGGRIRADIGQIEQVILNLVLNARDAMPNGGTLTITTADVDLDEAYVAGHLEAKCGPHVLIEVKDTGVGMDSETLGRLFEPFFTTKSPGEGTGLGLATVYGIVQQAGGHITVESDPGQGSTFRLYFPATEEEVQPVETPVTSTGTRGDETILVCEDNDMLRRMVVSLLTSQGYRVVEASSGEEALKRAAEWEGPLHLLVSDVVLPGMNGLELAAALAADRPGLRVIAMSGYAREGTDLPAELAAPGRILQKPFSGQSLLESVRAILDSPPP